MPATSAGMTKNARPSSVRSIVAVAAMLHRIGVVACFSRHWGLEMFRHVSTACLLGFLFTVAATSLAQATLLRTNCGAPIQSIALTQNAQFETTNSTFTRVTGAVANITVPAGTTRCVKVRFTAPAACFGPFGAECLIRALTNTVEMNPMLAGNQFLASPEDSSPQPNSYHWVSRLSPGAYSVQVQIRRNATATSAKLQYWAMDIEILN
jgi:hypothetical protein